MKRNFDLKERLIDFVILLDKMIEKLPNVRLANYLASQMIRSGTSPALNYGEAQSAVSQRDFVHKIQVILKELRETKISIKIVLRKNYLNHDYILPVLKENEELIAIFAQSVKTAKAKL